MNDPKFQILIVPDDGGEEELLLFDGTLRESHAESSIASMFPVGRGRDTTDHVQEQPTQLSVEIIVTETPLRALDEELVPDYSISAEAIKTARGENVEAIGPNRKLAAFERARAYYDRLNDLRLSATLLTVTTSLRQLSSMVITRLEAPVEGSGTSVTFAVDLQQIRIADSRETLDVVVPRLVREQDNGADNGTEITETAQQAPPQSFLDALTSSLGGG